MRLHHLVIIVSALVVPRAGADAQPEPVKNDDPLISKFPDFTAWFRNHGGTIDDRITIGYEPDSNIRGMIATAPIPAGTLLMHTPDNIVLRSPTGKDQCLQVEETKKELKLGEDSKWHVYFQFDDSKGSHVPFQWDTSNRSGGRAVMELQGLPPTGETTRHTDWYETVCLRGEPMTEVDWKALTMSLTRAADGLLKGRTNDEVDWKALTMHLTRAADIGLVPMYDLMNHHNGLINTKLARDAKGGLSVYALIDIQTEEPIYLTYARSGTETTIDVFNTYGFVEAYPQLWRWSDEKLVKLSQEDVDHANRRYGMGGSDANNAHIDFRRFVPNTPSYEVLVLSPTLAAILPTVQLVHPLGEIKKSMDEWQDLITAHHAHVRSSYAKALGDSAREALNKLPTTIEEDEALVAKEKSRLEKMKGLSKEVEKLKVFGMADDQNRVDAVQAMEYRLAFKKALKFATEVAERDIFLIDSDEL
eukprot:CAMPEP_0183787662 /NCGR_PEP_ID=MMETSP0739-20130205/67659_1 /TAXON_ID=385413 /ORGANISM="Thalassiosira miniscula, Strain CCMP1093" /LENGTH=474 /DNA_ID=CAMNT_0026031753 /DNA_START=26 /DNA_END=1454 /DNA_ORIENTATION=-